MDIGNGFMTKTMIPRRVFLSLAGTATGMALLPDVVSRALAAAANEMPWRGYRNATVIDSAAAGEWDDAPEKRKAIIDNIRKSGLTAMHITVNGDKIGSFLRNYEAAIETISGWNGVVADNADVFMQIRRAADLVEAKRSGRLGLIYAFQDSAPIGEDVDRVDMFHDFGVRVFQLTYNKRNLVGDGCLEPGNAGLSEFGRLLIAKLNDTHSLIDLSHAGERTTLEAIEASKAPIAITHTGCAAIAPNPRNKTDDELRRLAEKGGYVGIYLMPFLRSHGQPMAADVIAHIEHAIDVCGEDHVGIGTDIFNSPVAVTPEYRKQHADFIADRIKRGIAAPGEDPDVFMFIPDLNRADRFARIAELLASRKHSDARIAKILGGSFARLLKEVWGA
jgi:membrane dipeptidase